MLSDISESVQSIIEMQCIGVQDWSQAAALCAPPAHDLQQLLYAFPPKKQDPQQLFYAFPPKRQARI